MFAPKTLGLAWDGFLEHFLRLYLFQAQVPGPGRVWELLHTLLFALGDRPRIKQRICSAKNITAAQKPFRLASVFGGVREIGGVRFVRFVVWIRLTCLLLAVRSRRASVSETSCPGRNVGGESRRESFSTRAHGENDARSEPGCGGFRGQCECRHGACITWCIISLHTWIRISWRDWVRMNALEGQ